MCSSSKVVNCLEVCLISKNIHKGITRANLDFEHMNDIEFNFLQNEFSDVLNRIRLKLGNKYSVETTYEKAEKSQNWPFYVLRFYIKQL